MQPLPKVQFNVKIEADLKGRAYAAAKDAGQEIGVFVSRAIEARLGQLEAAETYAATKRSKR